MTCTYDRQWKLTAACTYRGKSQLRSKTNDSLHDEPAMEQDEGQAPQWASCGVRRSTSSTMSPLWSKTKDKLHDEPAVEQDERLAPRWARCGARRSTRSTMKTETYCSRIRKYALTEALKSPTIFCVWQSTKKGLILMTSSQVHLRRIMRHFRIVIKFCWLNLYQEICTIGKPLRYCLPLIERNHLREKGPVHVDYYPELLYRRILSRAVIQTFVSLPTGPSLL